MPGMIVDTGTEAWRKAGDCDNLLAAAAAAAAALPSRGTDGPLSGNLSKPHARLGMASLMRSVPESSTAVLLLWYCPSQHLLCLERVIGSKFKTGGPAVCVCAPCTMVCCSNCLEKLVVYTACRLCVLGCRLVNELRDGKGVLERNCCSE